MAGNAAAAKEAKAAAKAARKKESAERRAQLWQAFNMQRKDDKLLLPLMIGSLVAITVVFVVLALIFHLAWWAMLVPGLLVGALVAFVIFSRRVQRSAFDKVDGQAGAAAWVLENLQGKWRVTNAVAATAQMDAVHRVVGLPGVILVGEGTPTRVKPLLAQEKKRVSKLVGDTPIYDIIIGNDEGQIRLAQLQKHLVKLPRNIDAGKIDSLHSRLSAISARSGAAIPKGPMPAGAKVKGMNRRVRRSS